VIRTRVGYAGGTTTHPTYRSIGNHSETVQIDYDPTRVSYEELLEIFWTNHCPTSRPWSRQYMSIIFFHNEEQHRLALASRDREAAKSRQKILTDILPFTEFYLAEHYHQKHTLQQRPEFMKEFTAMYPDPKEFVDSTAVARVNGYLARRGTREQLQSEIDQLGLSELARQKLLRIVK